MGAPGAVDPELLALMPQQESDTHSMTSGTTGHVMSKASGQAIAAEHRAGEAVAQAQEAVGEAEATKAAAVADQQAQQADLLRQQAADQAAEHQAWVDRQQAARDAAAAAEQHFADHKFHDYWKDKSTGDKLLSAFSVFAGGAGEGLIGGANPALEAVNRKIARDFEDQKLEREQLREVARAKGADVNELFQQEQHENAALAIKHAKALEATAAAAVETATRAGIPLAQAQNSVLVKKALQGAEEKRREALQHYDRAFSSSTTNKEVQKTGGAESVAQARLGIQKQKELRAEVGEFVKRSGLDKLSEQRRAFESLEEKLKPGPNGEKPDPETQFMALQELDKAAKGGTATSASMAVALSHLGGSGDRFDGLLEKAKTGGLSPGQLNILRRAIVKGKGANEKAVATAYSTWDQVFNNDPKKQPQKPEIDAYADELFGPHGYSRKPKPAPEKPPIGSVEDLKHAASSPEGQNPYINAGSSVNDKPVAPPHRIVRLPSGEVGTLMPDRTFLPLPAQQVR